MFRYIYFSHAFLFLSLSGLACAAQQAAANPNGETIAASDKPSPSARQSAMNLVEEVLAGTGSLELPQNRLAIEMQAFPAVWTRSATRARALISQMAGELAAASIAINQRFDENPSNARTRLRQQRTLLARTIGNTDPELALLFLSTTLPCVQSNLPDDDPDDNALIADLAAQVALHDPRRALQLAEQELKDSVDLPGSFINLLEQVQRSDAQAGTHLFQEVVDHLKQQNLAEDSEELSFSASLLANQFGHQSESGHNPDSALRSLGEMVAAAVLTSHFSQDQPFQLSQTLPALDALVPAKSAASIRKCNSPRACSRPKEDSGRTSIRLAPAAMSTRCSPCFRTLPRTTARKPRNRSHGISPATETCREPSKWRQISIPGSATT